MQSPNQLATAISLLLIANACENSTPSTAGGANSTGARTTTGGTDARESSKGGSGEEDDSSDSSGGRQGSRSTASPGGSGGSSNQSQPSVGGTSGKSGTGAGGAGQTQAGGGRSSSTDPLSAGATSGKGQSSAGGASTKSSSSIGGTTSTDPNVATGGVPVTATVPIGDPHTGEITFYDDVGDGTCMFGVTGEVDVAALAIGSWDSAAWCGACADVTGPKGTIRVRVVNQCPSCGGKWDLDLNKPAFLKIQEEKVGRFSVSWNFVACGITTPVKYRFKEGSSPGWVGVLVSNLNLPITKFEWSLDQTAWNEAQRQSYNYFESSTGFGPNYVYVRITAVDGQVLSDRLPVAQPALEVTGKANFK